MESPGGLSVERMCGLVQISRASFYRSWEEHAGRKLDQELRDLIQRTALQHPYYGYRKMAHSLRRMRAQAQVMFQALLAERFQLVVHRESRIVPGYALVTLKSGAKMEAGEPGQNSTQGGNGVFQAKNISMPRFADFLGRFAGRPVEDKTELSGVFTFKLEWTPDEQPVDGSEHSTNGGPSLFTAIQEQLGLKLESQKVSVGVIVVDKAEKVPAAN